MPLVNLIKEDRLAAAAKERQVRGFALLLVFVGGLSVLSAGYFTVATSQENARVATLEVAYENAKPFMKQIEDNKSEITRLEPRILTLTSAQESTKKWYRILEHLKSNMPDGVWLTSVQCQKQGPDSGVTLSLKGLSTTQEAVGYLILRVDTSEDIETPNLVFTQERRTEKGRALEFEVTGLLAGSAPKQQGLKEAKGA